ncbi:MAG TPA: response regulator, partial [Vineibacter sp.]|nr:response regulator [Vineibacter sp.]
MVEDLGHTVIGASSGRRALDLLRNGRAIDLLMTDQAMPGMSGIELADAARQLRPGLPILLASGYAELPADSDLPRLSKPYDQDQLAAQIARLLNGAPRKAAAH